jgi:hypothetical protein
MRSSSRRRRTAAPTFFAVGPGFARVPTVIVGAAAAAAATVAAAAAAVAVSTAQSPAFAPVHLKTLDATPACHVAGAAASRARPPTTPNTQPRKQEHQHN